MELTRHAMFIDGEWRFAADGATYDVLNPATEEIVATAPVATAADIDHALEAADKGWKVWRAASPWDRCDCLRVAAAYLRDREELLAALLTKEQGKPMRESLSELRGTWQQFEWFADEARRIHGEVFDPAGTGQYAIVMKEAVGPVAAFAPWNFPALLTTRKLAPAIAAGCSVILKPADETPGIAMALAAALDHAGLPAGVLNIVTGNAPAIASQLMSSPVIRKVTLTGSIGVGQQLLRAAAERVVSATMELGGHAPVIVFPDVDPREAARRCVEGKFRNAGQVCISPSRFYVHEDIYTEFCDEFVERVGLLRLGDGSDPNTNVGPLGNSRRVGAMDRLVRNAVEAGAKVAIGGRRPTEKSLGYFYEPTVLLNVPDDATIMSEEPFGPVAPISSFRDFGEVVLRANSTEYGLAGFVLTSDRAVGLEFARQLDVGMVGINQFGLSFAGVHFGGIKSSGIGSESGASAMNEYLVEKALHLGPSLARCAARSDSEEREGAAVVVDGPSHIVA
jgi:succinate-semialdehyde dehydrogenase/glutarate-semialdehyde dehydrogenase